MGQGAPMIILEGVPYYRYRITWRMTGANGNRRQMTRLSPGFPWIREAMKDVCFEIHSPDGTDDELQKAITRAKASLRRALDGLDFYDP